MPENLSPADTANHFAVAAVKLSRLLRDAIALITSGIATLRSPEDVASTRLDPMLIAVRRASNWLDSLSKLTTPTDLQAVSCGNRALLELAVDMALLHADKTPRSAECVTLWVNSRLLRWAEETCNRQKRSINSSYVEREMSDVLQYRQRIALQRNHKRRSKAIRAPHPNRWTGEESLFRDIKRVESNPCTCWSGGQTFSSFYHTYYKFLNLGVHGSATNVPDVDTFLPLLTFLRGGMANAFLVLQIIEYEANALGVQFDKQLLDQIADFNSYCKLYQHPYAGL